MNLKEFCRGIEILRPYYDNPDGYHIGAEHDQFYLYATSRPVSPEDGAELRELGWFQEGEDEDEDGNIPYFPEEGWSAFV